MTKFLEKINTFVWGAPALALILGVGLFLTVGLGFPQLRLFPKAMGLFVRKLLRRTGSESSFRCLCTALAATVGTGNLAGVAGAICLGGPGAVFWMWVSGLLGMATKYAEATLAVRYQTSRNAERCGGPMYIITRGMGTRWLPLAKIYCLFGVLASFGVGNAAQINTLTTALSGILASFGRNPEQWKLPLGIFLGVIVGAVLLGGAGFIGKAAEKLIPAASAGYVLLCIFVLTLCFDRIPAAFWAIFQGAFSPKAVTGGMLGSAFIALRMGCSRGVFTNEAGMGTAAIAHGGAVVDHPCEQGLMGMVEVFLDTIVICTLTALVILCSGVIIPYGTDSGAALTEHAFFLILGRGASWFLTGAIGCFAFATILGWGLYGARCLEFLLGFPAWKSFAMAQCVMTFLAVLLETGPVWLLADSCNGLMAIPNLITLAVLFPEVRRLTIDYRKPGR